ncbi:MAG: hypothetical protein FVQ79_02030 [Planctomycetes bacterium]|nr:hypothetical protein [Planctomycetota bacterium]
MSDFSRPIRVACVGDSITYGAGIKDRKKQSYPARLGEMLGAKWDVKNFGVSGATMLKNGDKPYWKVALDKAVDFKPDVVVIKLGTNDSKPKNWKYKNEYSPDYLAMIETFEQTDGKPRIWLCYPVPVYRDGKFNISRSVVRDEIVPKIRKLARKKNLPTIDLYQALSENGELFPDGIHPNAEGAKLIAEEVYRTLTGKFYDITIQVNATAGMKL